MELVTVSSYQVYIAVSLRRRIALLQFCCFSFVPLSKDKLEGLLKTSFFLLYVQVGDPRLCGILESSLVTNFEEFWQVLEVSMVLKCFIKAFK